MDGRAPARRRTAVDGAAAVVARTRRRALRRRATRPARRRVSAKFVTAFPRATGRADDDDEKRGTEVRAVNPARRGMTRAVSGSGASDAIARERRGEATRRHNHRALAGRTTRTATAAAAERDGEYRPPIVEPTAPVGAPTATPPQTTRPTAAAAARHATPARARAPPRDASSPARVARASGDPATTDLHDVASERSPRNRTPVANANPRTFLCAKSCVSVFFFSQTPSRKIISTLTH